MTEDAQSGLTRRLAKAYCELDFEHLSPQVVERAKYLCLDHLGLALRGATTESSVSIQDLLRYVSPSGPAVVMGTSMRAAPEYSALANEASAHSLELDDISNDSSVHPGVFVFPTAFASAEIAPVSGPQFITAVAAGYDLAIRLGRALDPRTHYARGFHPTGTCGSFGSALVASKLLRLDEEHATWALGIAGSQASGSLEFLSQGAWTKRLHPGWAAHSGMLAALLASKGFTGPTSILEGDHGFLHAYSDGVMPDKMLEEFGDRLYITDVGIKPHACCRYKQGPIDCILDIMNDDQISANDVHAVTVGVLEAGYDIIAAPEQQKRNPRSIVDAQFSMPFGAAVALKCGKASLDEYTEANLNDPQIHELMAKVRCVKDDSLEGPYPRRWPAWVEIRTIDNGVFYRRTEYPRGDPENPLSWDQLEAKFRDVTFPVISSSRQDQIIGAINGMERLEDVRELAELAVIQ